MAERDRHLQEVLDGYARFLRDKNLESGPGGPGRTRKRAEKGTSLIIAYPAYQNQ